MGPTDRVVRIDAVAEASTPTDAASAYLESDDLPAPVADRFERTHHCRVGHASTADRAADRFHHARHQSILSASSMTSAIFTTATTPARTTSVPPIHLAALMMSS